MGNILFIIFDIFNFGLLFYLWYITLKNYHILPQIIPVHFDFYGKADHFGSKKYSLMMPILAAVLYVVLTFIVRAVEFSDFSEKTTPENADAQFLIMEIFMRWLLALVTLILLNIQDYMLRYSFNDNVKPRVPMASAVFSIIGSLIILFIFMGVFK